MGNNRQIDGGIINIAGTLSRIGTTTQSLQLVKYLQRSGYSAAYFECNEQNYIAGVFEQCLSLEPYKKGTMITCFDIDMYPGEFLLDFSDGNSKYDFLICDYGNMQLDKFNQSGFLSGDARILVGGWEPNERYELTRRLGETKYEDSIFMLSFIDHEIEPFVREQMGSAEQRTFCSPYMPDPFGTYPMQDGDMYPKLMYWVGEMMNKRPLLKVVD